MWRTKGTFHSEERREREGRRPFHFRWALGKGFSCEVCSVLYCLEDKAIAMAANRLQIQGDDSVLLRVTHANLKTFSADIRFSLQVPILQTNLLYFFHISNINLKTFCVSLSPQWIPSKKSSGKNVGLLLILCALSFMTIPTPSFPTCLTIPGLLVSILRLMGIPISFPFLKVASFFFVVVESLRNIFSSMWFMLCFV